MPWVWVEDPAFRVTCINIDDLTHVTTISFITQIVCVILTILTTGMICTLYCESCRRKNRISPELEEIYTRILQMHESRNPV
jgi:hypothetical protein